MYIKGVCMFDYSKAAFVVLLDDIKKFAKVFKTLSLVFTTGYFIYVLVTQSGFFIANIILASLFLIYTIFEFVVTKKDIKKIKRVVKHSYSYITLGIKLMTLGAMIYGIYTATKAMTPISIIFTTLMIVLWIFQVLLEFFIQIMENKIDLIVVGLNKDYENLRKPIDGISNVFKRIKGQEIAPPVEKSKEIIRLEKKIQVLEEEKKQKKEQQKAEKKSLKERLKLMKRQKNVEKLSEETKK